MPGWFKIEILCHEGWRDANLLAPVVHVYGLEVEACDEVDRLIESCPGCCFRAVPCDIHGDVTVH